MRARFSVRLLPPSWTPRDGRASRREVAQRKAAANFVGDLDKCLRMRPTSLIETRPGFAPRPRLSHVVFDFDGTLSWLRHGWPDIMCRLFREHLALLPGESEAALREMLLDDILALNGKASIHQMIRCAERARERGSPPPDPDQLLVEYQSRLDALIAERTGKILRGEARRNDFVIHGARPFLEELLRRGLTLIILSGTAEHRVRQEAGLLDLARYFDAHIYGGAADLAQSSKRSVIQRLLREEAIAGDHLLAIGDGPVEIEAAKEAGGLTIGIPSDEEENGSGKMHPQKRRQLLKAGADILIPDYREAAALLGFILGEIPWAKSKGPSGPSPQSASWPPGKR